MKQTKKINILYPIIAIVSLLLIILLSTNIINFKSNKNSISQPSGETNNAIENNKKSDIPENSTQDDDNQDADNKDNDNQDVEDQDETSSNNEVIVADDLKQYGEADDTISKEEKNTDYTFKIDNKGNITINGKNKISNISNAKSIKLFSPPAPYSILYILTEDGNIYQYNTNDYDSKKYVATKMTQYSNIKQIITYQKRGADKGGCDTLIIVDNNKTNYILDSFCI